MMATQTAPGGDAGIVAVSASPAEIEAGAAGTVTLEIRCVPPRDLRGQIMHVYDADRNPAGSVEIIAFDGEINRTVELAIRAPGEAGELSWSASLARNSEGETSEAAPAMFSLTVKAHMTTVLVWGVPTAVTVGDAFTVILGFKCSSKCRPTDRSFEIYDHLGKKVADGAFGTDVWPGTEAVYHAKVSLRSPAPNPGRYDFAVKIPPTMRPVAHEGAAATFAVELVPPPECEITVEIVDRESRAPLRNAQVVMHPYRATTDDRGVARLQVPKGSYRLLVSASKYMSFSQPVDVIGDLTTAVQLVLEPRQTIASIYTSPVRSNAT